MRWQRRRETVTTNVVLIEVTGAGIDEAALRQRIMSMPGVRWAAPNVGYTGDVKELDPNDPDVMQCPVTGQLQRRSASSCSTHGTGTQL